MYLSKLDDHIKWVTDTEIGHIDIEDIKTQVERPRPEAPLKRIKRSGLVEATIFPQSIQAPKFIMIITQFYNSNTSKCIDTQRRKVIDVYPDMLGFVFGIPTRDEVLLTTEEESMGMWNNNVISNKRHMNEN